MRIFHNAQFSNALNNLPEINALAKEGPARMIELGDHRYHNNVRAAARRIVQHGARLVLLAGPSSSGKTTTAHFLADTLAAMGHPAQILSTDDFYLGPTRAPLRPDGGRDLECPQAMDIPALQRCLRDLVLDGACVTPVFDFYRQRPAAQGRSVHLKPGGIAVLEGIHALNPLLSELLPADHRVMRLYISVQQEVRNGAEILLRPAQVRLVRRIVRDHNFRSTEPVQTLHMWRSVMEGEQAYITPWRTSADAAINSLHAYEFGVLRAYALPLLRAVEDEDPWVCREAQDLAFALTLFAPVPPALVPKNSLIREFIGGGLYES